MTRLTAVIKNNSKTLLNNDVQLKLKWLDENVVFMTNKSTNVDTQC